MDKKITIGLFNDTYFPFVDGVVMVVDNYARRLAKYANVVVFAPSIPGEEFDDSTLPYKVVRCQSFKVPFSDYSCSTPEITLNFKKRVDECKLDIIHIHSPFAIGRYAYNYAKRHKIPTVCTLHTQFDQNFIRLTRSKKVSEEIVKGLMTLYNKCDECWTVNVAMAKTLCNVYGYKKIPVIINNSTDMVPTKDIKKSRDDVNKKYKLKDNEKVFLFVGRINKLKNILFIVDALRILKNENFKFKMLFVGIGVDENMLKDYISNNDLEKEVIMCGKITDRDELRDLYVRADLFLFPSLYDTNSLVQIEAASQSTPTVFIESATSSTVTNMVNGFITKENPIEYADMILKVMRDNKLYKEVSNNAYKDLYKSWDDVVDGVYARYINLVNKNKKR
jgi:glycosyltransferase involved in cell wall biosynthesis